MDQALSKPEQRATVEPALSTASNKRLFHQTVVLCLAQAIPVAFPANQPDDIAM
jgi:hypothetical protein